MEGKVKCSGCGHSWDKSDSSKKDMFICHQCGKDNVMKNGGWLSKYNDSGFVQPNANDSKVSMSEDFVGLGYNTKGRNYSPAWGGQFQDGGFIPASPQEQISSALQPTSSDQQASPYLQKKDPVEFYKSFINSPEYARRQLLTGYSASPKDEEYGVPNAAASRKTRLASLENIDPITYDTRQPSDAKPGLYGGPSYININPSDYAGTSREAIEAHELGHLAGATTPGQYNRPGSMSAMEQDIFRKSMLPMKEPVLSGVQGSKEREASLRNLEDFQHLQKPEESKADLNALRFMMYDKGIYDITKGKKFTETDFEKAKQNLGKDRVFKRLTDRVGKKNFVNLMNIIASADDEEVTPIAMNGASMPGSVGFTYARTAGSAPSEGKYAKKTMASAQGGKDIDRVSTSDPRYAELYKNRQVGSFYDGAYSLPDLDEVTVTAPRSYTMDSLRDLTTAALYGAPANAMKLSIIPQAAMTEGVEALRGNPYDFSNVNPNFGGFTSNQRDLSQTMGYENPEGFLQNAANFGLSAIDPALVTSLASVLRKPLQKGAQQFGKNLIDNTWRLNPKAYQYNLPENAMYRGLGQEGMEDAVSSGLFRSKQNVEGVYIPGTNFKISKSFGINPYFSPNFQTAATYGDNFIAEVPRDVANWRNRYGRNTWSQIADKPIPIDEGRILQKDWLKGYKEVPQKEYGGDIPSAQNGQEMRFYQNGLDFKPKGMQDGGDMYQGLELPEFTITPYDEQYPFYKDLSSEEKKYINDESTIGRGVRAIATTGKRGQTAKDISRVVKDVEKFGYEATGIPGTIRFANDPVENLLGLERTLFNTAVSSSPFLPTTPYNQEDLKSTFNTIDAFGMASAIATPFVKPVGMAAKTAAKATRQFAQPHITSISNIANETLDGIQAINNVKKSEKLSMIDVPALPGIDKLKDVRNFGKELAELDSKSQKATFSDLNSLREKYKKLSEQAEEFKSSGIFKIDNANKQSSLQTDYDINLKLINNKLNKLSNFKIDDFINNLKKQGANEVALETLRNNPDLALRYSDTVSSFSDSRMAEEIITGDTLLALENFRTYPSPGKTTNFSPNIRGISSDRIDPNTGDVQWGDYRELKKVNNKIYEDDYGADKFYSYPFYKNIGDKILDSYSNLRLSGSPVVSPLKKGSEVIELMPTLFADRYNVGSMLRQASRYIDETPDALMFPAGSLSGDSYPLALNMMARELKNNPDSQLRLMGFGRSNELGFADQIKNPKLLQSELSQIIKGIEDVSGQRLPKPYIFGNNTDQVMLPKFAVSKGSTNKVIQDYLNNSSIADRLGVKRSVREVSSNPTTPISNPPSTINFDPTDVDYDFKNGGAIKDNQGYLNPDNFGKVVEIDSNDITMEGVNQPLLGISDTGDTKLMKPGKNYKFKGKKVTEFPVAKDGGWLDSYRSGGSVGINQLDAQPMKKLNQLLNFTNNPDKDNWLNKYN